jgi:hypothetical protein
MHKNKFAMAVFAAADAPKTPKPVKNEVTVAPVRTDIPMPTITSRRGSKSKYNLDELAVGGSIGIIGRTASSIASMISNWNRNPKFAEPKLDEAGKSVFKMTEIKNPDGTVTKVPTSEIETVQTREFFAVDCDPKTDPDKATVRIFRRK